MILDVHVSGKTVAKLEFLTPLHYPRQSNLAPATLPKPLSLADSRLECRSSD
jgi:hypothetical protein